MSHANTPDNSAGTMTIRLVNLDRDIVAIEGESILQSFRRAGLGIAVACGARGVCGNCKIRIVSGQAEVLDDAAPGQALPPTDAEWIRACRVRPRGDLVVEVSPRALASTVRAEVQSPGDEPTGLLSPGTPSLGLAIDLGTTNIVGSLIDRKSGQRLVSLGLENPQAIFGADLISRINYAVRTPDGDRELQSVIVQGLDSLASQLCADLSVDPAFITQMTVCGNTAMHHLLAGLPVAQLGRAPFRPATCEAMDLKARELGLKTMPEASLHLLPNIGGFVGGDHVAALLATEQLWGDAPCMLIDIGTNTEISLIHNGSIITASTASGPALEGGNISCGMRAAEGAIEKVWLSEGRIITRVIGGVSPLGLCGSGVLDALHTLHQAGIIDQRGCIRLDHPEVEKQNGLREFSLAPGVALTQDDVRAIQLAKAAIRAGIDLLLREAGLAEDALAKVVIAGAFGIFLDITSAMAVGMFPELPLERFTQVGNAAAVGVRMALVSTAAREHAQRLAGRCRHLDLGRLTDFQKIFLHRIGL